MLEKTGQIVLTNLDIAEYNKSIVSDRIKNTWGFSLDELREIIEANNFVEIKVK